MSSTKYYEASEDILARMKEDITEVSTIEGSDVHNSQAPVSVELSNTKLQLDEVLNKVFAKQALDNCYDEFLIKRCADYGITQKAGGAASGYITFNGQAGAAIPLNTIVTTETGLRYFTSAAATIAAGTTKVKVLVTAEAIGAAYNKIANTITYLPIKLINITSITNEEAFTNGYDIESMADLYARYLLKIQTPSTSGNENHYINWALEVSGCSGARVISLWNGNGTVKVVIINSNKVGADATLIANVAAHIEGERPIGATITVVSATELPINISVTLVVDTDNYTLATAKENMITNITSYLAEIAFKQTYVSYAKIGSIILATDGIEDYSSLLINTGTSNIAISNTQVAIMGSVV